MRFTVMTTIACTLVLLGGLARAEDPKFEYGKAEEVKKVVWKANAQLGFVLNTGNSNSVSVSGGGSVSRFDGRHKLQLDVGGTYAKSTITVANDANMDGAIGPSEVNRIEQDVAALWNVKLRYDLFLSLNNSLYLTGKAQGNRPAGKNVVAGAQIGYARRLYHSERHALQLELGFDYSYENLVVEAPDFHIASLRGFFGYALTLSKDTALTADVEVLCNMNPLDGGIYGQISPFEDTRVTGRASLNTRLWKMISFRLGFKVLFDNAPPPAPALGLPYVAGFLPKAEKVDTVTEAQLIINFL